MQLQLKMGGWIFKPKHLPIAILDKGILTKQWPLAGKFVEFKYSPKICQFWRI
jgi:hypothetical protein